MASSSTSARVASRFLEAAKRKPRQPPEPPPSRKVPTLDEIVQNVVASRIEAALEQTSPGEHLKNFKVEDRTDEFSDGTEPRNGSIGYVFTVNYPYKARAWGTFELDLAKLKLHENVEDELRHEDRDTYENRETIQADIDAAIKEGLQRINIPSVIDEVLKRGVYQSIGDEYDFPRELMEKIEDAISEANVMTTSYRAYDEDGDVDLAEYPNILLDWKVRTEKMTFGKPRQSGSTYQIPVQVFFEMRPDRWAYGQETDMKGRPDWRGRLHPSFYGVW